MIDPNLALAMAALSHCRSGIRAARIDAAQAAARLTGQHHAEAQKIADLLAVALSYTESLVAAVRMEV